MVTTKREDVKKQGFCKILWRKLRLRWSLSYYSTYSIFFLSGWEWKWGLGGGGRLLTFSAFGMGFYLRWALIWGWALIRINTVSQSTRYVKRRHIFLNWVLREEGKFTALCSRPPYSVILECFTLYSCSIGKSDVLKNVMHVQRFLSYWCRHRRDIFKSLLPCKQLTLSGVITLWISISPTATWYSPSWLSIAE